MEAANDGDAGRRNQAGDPNLNVQNDRENMADLPADPAAQKAEFAFQPANFNNNSLVSGAAQEQEMQPLNEAAEMSIVNGNNATQACFADSNSISREVHGSATNYVTEIEGDNLQATPFLSGDNSVAEELNPRVADEKINSRVRPFSDTYSSSYVMTCIEEEHLWECKQLGVHSPQVLLNTLIYFNTKYFNLRTIADHKVLAFNNIIKHWSGKRDSGSKPKGMLLRLHANRGVNSMGAQKIYEQLENIRDPFRCPVKMYEFYLSKCPDSVKSRSDVFYLQPERYCTPDSPVWYSSTPLGESVLAKMLNRTRLVNEINVAFLNDLSG